MLHQTCEYTVLPRAEESSFAIYQIFTTTRLLMNQIILAYYVPQARTELVKKEM